MKFWVPWSRCVAKDVEMEGDAHIKNLRKIKKRGIDGFLQGKRHW